MHPFCLYRINQYSNWFGLTVNCLSWRKLENYKSFLSLNNWRNVTGVLYTRETAFSPFFTMKRVLRNGNTCSPVLLSITDIRVTRIFICVAIDALNCKFGEVSFCARSKCVDISMTSRRSSNGFFLFERLYERGNVPWERVEHSRFQ